MAITLTITEHAGYKVKTLTITEHSMAGVSTPEPAEYLLDFSEPADSFYLGAL